MSRRPVCHRALSIAEALRDLELDIERGWRRKDLVDAFVMLAKTHRLERLARIFTEQRYSTAVLNAV